MVTQTERKDTTYKSEFHPAYRADIDGLRALAIIAVVIFHAFPSTLPSGYVGVDVFFVISGFLISSIIIKGLAVGDFDARSFYTNRARRILPALIIVVSSVFVFGWFTLLPDEFGQLGKQTAASMGFVQNFILWRESGYFDTASSLKPLLHVWSLSIEEQFYLIYPLMLWIAWRRRLNLALCIAALALVSLAINLSGVVHSPAGSFYLPQARFWELMAGGLLACWKLSRPAPLPGRLRTAAINLASAVGLALIVVAACVFDDHAPYPGWRAMLPVLGACLTISAEPDAWCSRVLLANPLMVFIGLISYPLYLWHWPLLSYVHILGGAAPAPSALLVAVAASVVLAWGTYRFAERPIRFRATTWRTAAVLVSAAALLGATGLFAFAGQGLPERAVAKLNPTLSTGATEEPIDYLANSCGPNSDALRQTFLWCQSDKRGKARFALYGDSKAAALSKEVFRQSSDKGRWIFIGKPAFLPVVSTAGIYAAYQSQAKAGLAAVAGDPDIELVVLTVATRSLFNLLTSYTIGDLPNSRNLEPAFDGMDRLVGALVASGKKVVITVDNPTLVDQKYCIFHVTAIHFVNILAGLDRERRGCAIGYDRQIEFSRKYRTLLERLAQKYPDQLRIFDPTDLLCDMKARVCPYAMDGKILYGYGDHVSEYAASLIAKRLVPFVEAFAESR